jgi:hypothetical protein
VNGGTLEVKAVEEVAEVKEKICHRASARGGSREAGGKAADTQGSRQRGCGGGQEDRRIGG